MPEASQFSDQRESSMNGHEHSNSAGTSELDLGSGERIQQVQMETFVRPESEKLPSCPGTSSETSCQCVLIALNLLEKLQTEDHRSNSETVDQVLKHSKYALIQCLELTNCQACMNTSRFTMLVISLCQVVVAGWEKAVSTMEQQRVHREGTAGIDEESQHGGVTEDKARPKGLLAGDPNIYFRSYEVDDSEQLYVFATLARLQLSNWRAFLIRVKSTVLHLQLETQSSMVQNLDRRVSTQQDICTEMLLGRGNILKRT